MMKMMTMKTKYSFTEQVLTTSLLVPAARLGRPLSAARPDIPMRAAQTGAPVRAVRPGSPMPATRLDISQRAARPGTPLLIAVRRAVMPVFLVLLLATQLMASPFSIHGVVEGFYGRHWTPEERLDVIRFMGEVGLQSYFYAPKDDPFHRSRWREPYEGKQLHIFEELLETARKHDVTLWYALSPGLDMVYSSEEDYQSLRDKMTAMTSLGIRHLALFLDDVPETLNHAADRERFANLAEAHVHVINRLYADLQPLGVELVVCPTTYTDAWGDRDYIRILGKGIPKSIPLFWTGTDVAIDRITADQARFWGEKMRRPPLIWDNFPVNDYDRWRVFLGPLEGRDPLLSGTTSGLVANPMNQPYASMLSLATVAYFVRDPFNYDPELAIDRALRELYPKETIPWIQPLISLYRQPGWEDNVFTSIYTPGKPRHVETIREALEVFRRSLDGLAALGYDGQTGLGADGQPALGADEQPTLGYDGQPTETSSLQERRVHGLVSELRPFLENTTRDFKVMLENSDYRVDERGMLRYVTGRQTLLSRPVTFDLTHDGDLTGWEQEAFYTIPVAGAGLERQPEMAIVHDEHLLYFGFRFYREGSLQPLEPFYRGDHILLFVDNDPSDPVTWVKPQDPLVIMQPGKGHKTRVMELTSFTQRGISDIHLYTLTSFFHHPVVEPRDAVTRAFAAQVISGWQETEYGYSAVLGIPHGGREMIRATAGGLMTTESGDRRQSHRFLLSRRPYLGNTYTFPVIRLAGPWDGDTPFILTDPP